MKNFFKFIPAALAVLALASCSNDELLGEQSQAKQDVASKGDLRMSWDAFDNEGGTRAMRDNNFGTLRFEDGDQVNVYSEDLYKTDWYTFDTDAFYYNSEGEKMVDNPKFGVMPGEMVKKAYIDRATRTTRVDMEIPQVITYDASSETSIDGKAMYACNLPAFGYATLNPEGYVEVANLRYMTAILKINLEKVVSNASWLRLINYGQGGDPTKIFGADDPTGLDLATAKPLSGIMTAELYSDPAERKNVKLAALDETLAASWAPYIYVDLRSVPSNITCIYIPVVAGLDGDLDNIRLEYSRELGDDPDAFLQAEWHNIPGMAFPGKEFKQHSRYSGAYAFEFADMNPHLVSMILNQYQSTSNDIDIDVTNSFTIDKDDPDVDRTIYVPAFENDVNVNITLADGFATWTRTAGYLRIMDADPENPFQGTITLNFGDKIKATAAANAATMRVDLAEGTAIIAGEFTNNQQISAVAGNIQLGDGTTKTEGFKWYSGIGDDVLSVTIAENATLADDIDCSAADNKTKTVLVAGEMTGDITASPAATADAKTTITVSGKLTQTTKAIDGNGGIFVDVNVSGQVVGDIDLKDAVKGKITINGGDETDADAKVVVGNVTMKGDVDVALTAEGEAITGTLQMVGAAKTLTLKQGFINTVEVKVSNAGSWEDKYINFTLDDAEGVTAFLTLTETADNGVAKFSKSTWSGKKITNATYKDKQSTTPDGGKGIFTAAQFASFNGIGNDITLNNNIDLNNKAWTGYAQKGKFEGAKVVDQDAAEDKYPTISNLNLKKEETTETEYANGLFSNNTAASTVSNLTIDGVTGEFAYKKTLGIGGIYATVANAATFDNVTVKGIAINNTKEMTGVGGLVGIAKAAVTATSATVAGTIDGYSCLGGFVGTTNSNATFDKSDATGIAFKQTYDSGKAMDIEYAKISGFIGNVKTATAVIEIKGASKAPTAINFDKEAKMYSSNVAVGTGNFFKYNNLQNFIGFSGNTIGGTTHMGTCKINQAGTELWCAEAGWGIVGDDTDLSHLDGTITHNYLYNWPAK
jgi:hypothetical protein